MRTIFHITKRHEWENAKETGQYYCASLVKEGFIHCSRPHQVKSVADNLFKGQDDLVLLQINQEQVSSTVKYEGGDNNKFPHLYGSLNIDAVVAVFSLAENADGFSLPPQFKLVGDTLVRPAILGDEAEITNVNICSWQQSYKQIIPQQYLDSMHLQFRSRYSGMLSILQGKFPGKLFVAESSTHGIVGFIGVGPGRDEDRNGYGEVGAIYCLNEYREKGIGYSLFQMGLKSLADQDFSNCYLWVLEKNPTRSFYEKVGGKLTSRKKIVEIGEPLSEVSYEWSLAK